MSESQEWVTVWLDVSEETIRALNEAEKYDPAFLQVFTGLSIYDLAYEQAILDDQEPGAIHSIHDPYFTD